MTSFAMHITMSRCKQRRHPHFADYLFLRISCITIRHNSTRSANVERRLDFNLRWIEQIEKPSIASDRVLNVARLLKAARLPVRLGCASAAGDRHIQSTGETWASGGSSRLLLHLCPSPRLALSCQQRPTLRPFSHVFFYVFHCLQCCTKMWRLLHTISI